MEKKGLWNKATPGFLIGFTAGAGPSTAASDVAYADWIKRFILFHRKGHPEEMGAAEVFHLAVGENETQQAGTSSVSGGKGGPRR